MRFALGVAALALAGCAAVTAPLMGTRPAYLETVAGAFEIDVAKLG